MPDAPPAACAHAIEDWFAGAARDLPWRPRPIGAPRDPYHALVSELMLQQTQVARVVDRFQAFIERFPDIETLARAREPSVLALWSGLGYYRRARHLHAAAKAVVANHDARVPADASTLAGLPGIGAYTAGAISSIVFGQRVPAVDANVVRVMLRVEGAELTPIEGRAPATERARSWVEAARAPGVLNEGLMELGATVCTPRKPRCDACPLAPHCRARAEGTQERIPRPAARAGRRPLWCAAVVVMDARGRVLMQRRPASGLWAGLWQAPTIERDDRPARPDEVAASIGAADVEHVTAFERTLTHRHVHFDVYRTAHAPDGDYKTPAQIARLGMSSAQRAVLDAVLETAR